MKYILITLNSTKDKMEAQLTMEDIFAHRRKDRAKEQNMKITYYNEIDDNSFQVGIMGSRKLPYILNFSSNDINCSCPDFTSRQTKPICKHIYLVIHLAKNNEIFNQINQLDNLKTEENVKTIKENLLKVIDKKKMDANNSDKNTISIERDDYCSICMGDLENNIEKCSNCSHVIHISCLTGWWGLSTSWNSNQGKCPYCRDNKGFSHIQNEDSDPWNEFQFQEKVN